MIWIKNVARQTRIRLSRRRSFGCVWFKYVFDALSKAEVIAGTSYCTSLALMPSVFSICCITRLICLIEI